MSVAYFKTVNELAFFLGASEIELKSFMGDRRRRWLDKYIKSERIRSSLELNDDFEDWFEGSMIKNFDRYCNKVIYRINQGVLIMHSEHVVIDRMTWFREYWMMSIFEEIGMDNISVIPSKILKLLKIKPNHRTDDGKYQSHRTLS